MSFFLHNHLRFTVLYNRDASTDLARIVGFEVEPFSVKHEYEKPWDKANPVLKTCNPGRMISVSHTQPPLEVKEGNEAIFTYDIKFTVRTWWEAEGKASADITRWRRPWDAARVLEPPM